MAWASKIADLWCTQLITGCGLVIPTVGDTLVPAWRGENYSSATVLHRANMQEQFDKFLAAGVVERVEDQASLDALVVNPVGAADKKENGVVLTEKRWYLDFSRHVNDFLPRFEMHLPSYDDALERLSQGCFMAKIDLSAAFLHVIVHPRSRRLLGFKWRGEYYQFTRMIFGLSLAPAVWQYITERVCDFFRTLGFIVLIYLDDFLLIADTLEKCTAHFERMRDELRSLGLKINEKKLIHPAQTCRWLGLDIDSVKMEIRVPEYKLKLIKDELDAFEASYGAASRAPLRSLLSLVGRLSHVSRAVRSSRFFLRYMWDAAREHQRHCSSSSVTVQLSPAFWLDFEWWKVFLSRWNGVARWPRPADVLMFSDACLSGFGFHCGLDFRFGAWPAEFH